MDSPHTHEMRKGIALIPNLLTTVNMFCGFFAMTKAIKGEFHHAVWLILLAMIFDFLDGRIARMTKTESKFGLEYDSLADLCTFCLAPAVLTYTWSLMHLKRFGFAACFLFFVCGALRLARYNVQSKDIEKNDFQGLPSPAAAATLSSFILFFEYFFNKPVFEVGQIHLVSLLSLALTVLLGFLMVSNVRYQSTKKVRKQTSFVYLILIVAGIFVIAAEPEITVFLFGVAYTLSGLIHWIWKKPKKDKGMIGFLKSLYIEVQEKKRIKKARKSLKRENSLETPEEPSNVINMNSKNQDGDLFG